MNRRIAAWAIAALVLVPSLRAADPFYIGAWKITSAVVAPWWDEKAPPDPSESKTLLNQTVTIGTAGITGVRIVACKNPKYKVRDFPADSLFQGSFGEMHDRDKSADPAKVAEKLGFKGSKWKTLETGCGNELDYHFLDPMTAAFGLNNYIYFLKKQ